MTNAAAARTGTKLTIEKGKGYALFIALLPVLMMYKVPVVGIGVSTALIIALSFYSAAVIFSDILRNGGRLRVSKLVLPFVIYLLYVVARSTGETVNMIQTLLIIVHILAFSLGAVNAAFLKKCTVTVAVAASGLTLLQTAFYYTFNIHLPCIAPDLCLDSLWYYRDSILTGFQETGNLYRPSAFFLEPSHLTQYAFVALLLCLFHGKRNIPAAICISAGMIATTSGMGILLTAGIWFLFLLESVRRSNLSGKLMKLSLFVLGSVLVFLMMMQFGFFRSAILRIFSPIEYSQDSYNAIWGRTLYWNKYISPMQGSQLLFGLGYVNLPEEYFTGLMEMLYCSGILGVVLYYFAMLSVAVRCRGIPRMISLLLCGMMIMANFTSIISMTYYIGVLLTFAVPQEEENAAPGSGAPPASPDGTQAQRP